MPLSSSSDRLPDGSRSQDSTVAGLNNASKNYQGMLDGYAGSGMLERKQKLEACVPIRMTAMAANTDMPITAYVRSGLVHARK